MVYIKVIGLPDNGNRIGYKTWELRSLQKICFQDFIEAFYERMRSTPTLLTHIFCKCVRRSYVVAVRYFKPPIDSVCR